MVDDHITGPDGIGYSVNFLRNTKIEDLLFEISGKRYTVHETKFPWVKKTFFGYKIKMKDGWKSFPCPIRSGAIDRLKIVIHIELTPEQKVAVSLHELAHIVAHHPEGQDLGQEKQATAMAIGWVEKYSVILKKHKYNPSKIIKELKTREQVYEEFRI